MTGIDGTVELLRDQLRLATARAKAAEAALTRAQELQRGAEAQHCAALARVGELEDARTAWRNDALAFQGEWAEAAEQRDAAEAKLANARGLLQDALDGGATGMHAPHCRCLWHKAVRAALSDEEPAPAVPPCGGSRCFQGPGGEWIHSSKSYGSCAVRGEGGK